MNRFNLGLHQALFLEGGSEKPRVELVDTDSQAKILESARVVSTSKREETILRRDVLNSRERKVKDTVDGAMDKYKSDYYHACQQVGQEVLKSRQENSNIYSPEQLNTFKTRARDRQAENYQKWNESIRKWYEDLIRFLAEGGYFYTPKAKTVAKVQEKYMDAVSKHYADYVLDTEDGDFDKIKEKLFTLATGDKCPANIVCKELTWASSISARGGRSFREWYGVDVVRDVERGEWEEETWRDRANRHFLSRDLPNYLYDAVVGRVVVFGKDLYLGIKDRPSEADRDAIEKFVIASSRIEVESWDKDPAVALLQAFRDNNIDTNTTKRDYKYYLESRGIKIKKDRYLDSIIEAWQFYLSTQRGGNSERDQHAIYLNILKIIEDEGWVANAVKKFKPLVMQERKEKAQESEQNYESWEVLQAENSDLYDFVTKLKDKWFITDFAAATRLAKLKDTDYFQKVSIDRILANIDNDRKVYSNDRVSWGLTSGAQFRRIFNQIWEDKVLSNLLEHAKLLNNSLGLGLDDSKFKKEVAKQEIKWWNLELILLLQRIIADPKQDIYALLSGKGSEDTANLFEGIDLGKMEKEWKLKEEAFKKAREIINKEEFLETYAELFKWVENVDIESFADLQTYLAWCLYDNYEKDYKAAVTAWTTISFDDWCDWLYFSFWWGIADGKGVAWFSVWYSHTWALKHGWTLTGGFSEWLFIPVVSWDPSAFASVWLDFTLDKKTIDLHTGTVSHRGVDVWFNILTDTLYAWRHKRWDKSEGIREASRFQAEFQGTIMLKMLDQIKTELKGTELKGKKMDLNDKDINAAVKKIISDMVEEQPDIPEESREAVVNGMLMRLAGYNNVNLDDEWVKYAIAEWIAAQYAQTWSEQRKTEISAKWDGLLDGVYLSWYSIWAYWLVWTPKGGVYASVEFKKHKIDGAGDRYGNRQKLDSGDMKEWSDESIREKNQELWLSGADELKVRDWFVVIPASIKNRINVNEKMQWLMKLGDNGDVLVDVHTPISSDLDFWSQTGWNEIRVWWKDWKHVKLDRVLPNWFTSDTIDYTKVSQLVEKIDTYDEEMLNDALGELKKRFPGDPIQNFDLSEQSTDLIDKLNKLDKTKGAIIVISPDENWKLVAGDPVEWNGWKGLELEYKGDFEMMDKAAKEIADAVYAEALKTTNPRYLNAVKHDRDKRPHREEYDAFAEAIQEKDYVKAKEKIMPIFEKLDANITGAHFTEIWRKLNDISDIDVLWQALMSINNVFARSVKVRWWGENYEFKTINWDAITMWSIIAEREGQISNTIENYQDIDEPSRRAYIALIEASKKYRENNRGKFNKKTAPAASLTNTVWFNLWDKNNPENPLFNPEIYDPMIDLEDLKDYGFKEEDRKALQEHTMRLFASNEILRNPIFKRLWLDGRQFNIGEFKLDGEKWKLTLEFLPKDNLDILPKKVTLSAWMKFGYFTQCVNHTVILNDISLELEDWSNVEFGSDVWEDGRVRTWYTSSLVSTRGVKIWVSFGVWEEKQPEEWEIDHHSDNDNDGFHKPGDPATGPWTDGNIPPAPGTWLD